MGKKGVGTEFLSLVFSLFLHLSLDPSHCPSLAFSCSLAFYLLSISSLFLYLLLCRSLWLFLSSEALLDKHTWAAGRRIPTIWT